MLCHFNSKMVRLRAVTVSRSTGLEAYFNSKMVRLRAVTVSRSTGLEAYFNSKMVRLRDQPIRLPQPPLIISIPKWCDWEKMRQHGDKRKPAFQFQNGAIERVFSGGYNSLIPPFQFQNGAIESNCRFAVRRRYHISIPKWCDWEWEPDTKPAVRGCISIPKWCDWENTSTSTTHTATHFNSKMVRLRAQFPPLETSPSDYFNSKMVRLRGYCAARLGLHSRISIPKWCDWEKTR